MRVRPLLNRRLLVVKPPDLVEDRAGLLTRPYSFLSLKNLCVLCVSAVHRFSGFLFVVPSVLLIVLLAACGEAVQSNDPVFIVATPVPPDAQFVTYRHSTGAFSLRVPPDWIAGELPDPNGVRVQFTSLEGEQAITRLSVYLVNTGQP
ncbi:MAG: hypothetical protein EHM39_11675, partial [Chloroflexi bacterium]